MIRASLTGRDRRTIAAGATLIAILLVVFRGLPTWLDWRAAAFDLATSSEAALAADRALLEQLPHSMAALDVRIARLRDQDPAPLVVRDPGLASLALVSFVHDAGRAAGASLPRVELQNGESGTDNVGRVSVLLHGDMDAFSLARLLRQLEAGPVLTRIRRLAVEAHDLEAASDRPQMLAVRIEIESVVVASHSQENP